MLTTRPNLGAKYSNCCQQPIELAGLRHMWKYGSCWTVESSSSIKGIRYHISCHHEQQCLTWSGRYHNCFAAIADALPAAVMLRAPAENTNQPGVEKGS